MSKTISLRTNQLPDREFMWNVLHTLKPQSTKALIEDAFKNRGIENEEDKNEMIEIAPEHLEKLIQVPTQRVSIQVYYQYCLIRSNESIER